MMGKQFKRRPGSDLGDPINATSGIKRREIASVIPASDTINYDAPGLGGTTYKKFAARNSPAAKSAIRSAPNMQRKLMTEDTDPHSAKNYSRSTSMTQKLSDEEKAYKRRKRR